LTTRSWGEERVRVARARRVADHVLERIAKVHVPLRLVRCIQLHKACRRGERAAAGTVVCPSGSSRVRDHAASGVDARDAAPRATVGDGEGLDEAHVHVQHHDGGVGTN
jgi:hypothetical protein